jgi:hypothetical protein
MSKNNVRYLRAVERAIDYQILAELSAKRNQLLETLGRRYDYDPLVDAQQLANRAFSALPKINP